MVQEGGGGAKFHVLEMYTSAYVEDVPVVCACPMARTKDLL